MGFYLKSFFGPLFSVFGTCPVLFVRIGRWLGIPVPSNTAMVSVFCCTISRTWAYDGHIFTLGNKGKSLISNVVPG